MCGGGEFMGNLHVFLSNFVVKLKLLLKNSLKNKSKQKTPPES